MICQFKYRSCVIRVFNHELGILYFEDFFIQYIIFVHCLLVLIDFDFLILTLQLVYTDEYSPFPFNSVCLV